LLLNEIIKVYGRITHSLILITAKNCIPCIRLYALMEQLEIKHLKFALNLIYLTNEQHI